MFLTTQQSDCPSDMHHQHGSCTDVLNALQCDSHHFIIIIIISRWFASLVSRVLVSGRSQNYSPAIALECSFSHSLFGVATPATTRTCYLAWRDLPWRGEGGPTTWRGEGGPTTWRAQRGDLLHGVQRLIIDILPTLPTQPDRLHPASSWPAVFLKTTITGLLWCSLFVSLAFQKKTIV